MFVWSDYLKIARNLVVIAEGEQNGIREGYYRIAISRGYYACLMAIKEKNDNNNVNTNNGGVGSHIDIIDGITIYYAKTSNKTTVDTIRNQMRQLKNARQHADYQSGSSLYTNDKYTNNMLQVCTNVMALIEALD